jgi:hypothetical protein
MRDVALDELARSGDQLTGRVRVEGRPVELTVFLGGAPPEELLPATRELGRRLPELTARARQELVREFLPAVNGGYLGDGEPPLDETGFLSRAALHCIELEIDAPPPEGSPLTLDTEGSRVAFQFHDGGMLWGHWMIVEVWHGTEWSTDTWG